MTRITKRYIRRRMCKPPRIRTLPYSQWLEKYKEPLSSNLSMLLHFLETHKIPYDSSIYTQFYKFLFIYSNHW